MVRVSCAPVPGRSHDVARDPILRRPNLDLMITPPSTLGISSAAYAQNAADDAVYRKITRRFVPLLFLCYVFNYMDRTNIGFAQLQMKGDLGFSDVAYGVGAGIFFVSYSLFGFPSNLIMNKVGAR